VFPVLDYRKVVFSKSAADVTNNRGNEHNMYIYVLYVPVF
jgi:hypothetical protein